MSQQRAEPPPRYPCACCGHQTLEQEDPSWETCPVCYWQSVPRDDWQSNRMTLTAAQENYAKIGACDASWQDRARAPRLEETRHADWQSLKVRRSEALPPLEFSIDAAFGDVLREGGVTLHQMDVLDGYGSPAELAEAAKLDPESAWQDVAEAKLTAFGTSLVFLDAKGFRFYLPAYLRLIARQMAASCFSANLCGAWFALRGSNYDKEHHYALLSLEQKTTTAIFLSTMKELGDPDECRDAAECLEAYWHSYVPPSR